AGAAGAAVWAKAGAAAKARASVIHELSDFTGSSSHYFRCSKTGSKVRRLPRRLLSSFAPQISALLDNAIRKHFCRSPRRAVRPRSRTEPEGARPRSGTDIALQTFLLVESLGESEDVRDSL